MKLARRLLSLLLVLLMVFALAACSGGGDVTDSGGGGDKNPFKDPSPTPNPGDEVHVMPDRPVDETEGKEYIIIQHEPESDPFGYAQDSNMGLQVADRIAEVEELYGCTIEFSEIAYGSGFVTQMQALRFAENSGDLVFAHKNAYLRKCLGTGGEESLLQDLLAVDDIINFWNAEKWGTITAREAMMAGGTFYGVAPALWVDCTPLPYYQIVYNKTLVENAGLTDPQEYWENEEWDRYAMVDIIVGTTDEASGVWGMTAAPEHMLRATYLSTGMQLATIDNINADKTVEWTNGLKTPEAAEAIQWLKNTLTANAKCFNNGSYSHSWGWATYTPFNEGACGMAVTRPIDLFDYVVIDSKDPFGLTVWGGADANVLSGYYEHVYSVGIPVFAQNPKHSAFLMADLFEGLEDVESYEDVIAYYGDKYFESELDLEMLIRPGATLQYSYWPNDGIDDVWTTMRDQLMSLSVANLIERYAGLIDTAVENHIVPNKVALQEWSQVKDFD